MKEDQIPTPEFQEEDADRLIASFGKTPDPELRGRLQALLQRELENHRICNASPILPASEQIRLDHGKGQLRFLRADKNSQQNGEDTWPSV